MPSPPTRSSPRSWAIRSNPAAPSSSNTLCWPTISTCRLRRTGSRPEHRGAAVGMLASMHAHSHALSRSSSIQRLEAAETMATITHESSPAWRSLVEALGLQPHPEGGYYRETFRSATRVEFNGMARSAGTSIYYLLTEGATSAWHRLDADEVWYVHAGGP